MSGRKYLLTLLAILYAAGAIFCAWTIIVRTQASTDALEKIFSSYSLQNEGAEALESFDHDHPILGTLFSSPVKNAFELSSPGKADSDLHSGVTHQLRVIREESSVAGWWSWSLLCLSLCYLITVVALERSFNSRAVLFALTTISVIFFWIGIIAPAMVIWTAPSIPMQSGPLNFVVQYQVRGIAAIIWELLTSDHWIIGGFLLLFSIMTPLTKASLTFFVTASRSKSLNYRVGQVLHTIGKWSMADVFVAAILLALYALKFQQATKSIACLGLYYFFGYCLLSLSTTELLVHSGVVAGNDEEKATRKLGKGVISGLFAGLVCFILLSSLYTYQQYTLNTKKRVNSVTLPQKLDNSDLVLPVHK